MTRHTATADQPLPLEEFAEVAEVDQLRAALADALRYIEDPGTPAPGNRVRAWRAMVGRATVPGLEDTTPEQRAEEGIARAAARWTPEEEAAVDAAIATVARRIRLRADHTYGNPRNADEAATLTTADVWAELGADFPVTKGIAGRMTAAKGAGLIANTGRTVIAPRDATGPNHGQRLTVWRAL